MARRAKLTVAYLGGPFAGWQRQPATQAVRTVQGELEAAFGRMTRGLTAVVVGAGRTDAGVHARGQVAHLDVPDGLPLPGLVKGMNGALPEAIRVLAAGWAPAGFHARHSARGKHYAFRFHWGPPQPPWVRLRSARVAEPVHWATMEAAVLLLPGRRDWASFTVPDPSQGPTVRELASARLVQHGRRAVLHVTGGGFLRYQVRRLAGALLEIGAGQRTLADLRRLLEEPEPGAAVATAPARGLTLERVWYRARPVLDSGAQG